MRGTIQFGSFTLETLQDEDGMLYRVGDGYPWHASASEAASDADDMMTDDYHVAVDARNGDFE